MYPGIYTLTSKFQTLCAIKTKAVIIRRLNNTVHVLNDISSMYLAGVCTVGAFVWVH